MLLKTPKFPMEMIQNNNNYPFHRLTFIFPKAPTITPIPVCYALEGFGDVVSNSQNIDARLNGLFEWISITLFMHQKKQTGIKSHQFQWEVAIPG